MGTPPGGIDDSLRHEYLQRLGLEAEPPSVDALQRLHRRHVERIPYETMWMHAGERWGIDPVESASRIARDHRGGYCYHLNGALSELHEALPLVAGEYEHAPFRLTLEATDGAFSDWYLTHDPAGGFTGMSWSSAEAEMARFAADHEWMSTEPESQFMRVALAQRRDATGVDVMRGLVLARIGDDAAASEPLTEREEWFGPWPTRSIFASKPPTPRRSTTCGIGSSPRTGCGTRPDSPDRSGREQRCYEAAAVRTACQQYQATMLRYGRYRSPRTSSAFGVGTGTSHPTA